MVEAVEPCDHRRPFAVFDDPGLAQVPDLVAHNAHRHLDGGAASLERLRTVGPGDGEVEVRRAKAGLGAFSGGDPRHAVDPLLPTPLRKQIPDACLEDEAERVEAARHHRRALAVAHVEAAAAPERARDHRQVRDSVLFAKPATRVDVEEPRRSAGAVLQLRGQRRQELQPCGGQLAAEPKLCGRPDEERLRLRGVESVSFVR